VKNKLNKTINLQLEGLDGNAWSLLGTFAGQAKKEDWTDDEIGKVLQEARSGDYDHLLQTLIEYTN
jgi:hypothetical protein